MTCSDAGLARLERAVEFERLASALDDAHFLLADGRTNEAYEYLTEIIESFPKKSIFEEWFTCAVLELMEKEARTVLID